MVETSKHEEKPTEDQSDDIPKVKKNWADDEDENDSSDEDRAIGGSGAVASVPSNEPEKPKFIPPIRSKNARGDFVVTTINIKEKEIPQMIRDEETSSEEESEEEPEKEEVEEKKPEPVKKLSKKEQKAKEQAEFEALMGDLGVKEAAEESKDSGKKAPAKKEAEESVDEKK